MTASEPSESRMREALNRLSGDRSPAERGGDRGADRAGERSGDRLDRMGGDRFGGGGRSQPQPSASFGSAAPRRHRYVQDGEVPVVQISSMRDRRPAPPGQPAPEPPSEQMRVQLAQERAARQSADHLLERAQAMVHGLETRLGHAEIIQREAVEQARAHAAEVARLQAELAEMATRLQAAETRAAAARERQQELEQELEALRSEAVLEAAVVPEPPALLPRVGKPRGRPAGRPRVAKVAPPVIEAQEPEPVKRWLTPAPKKARPRRTR
jgi:hypothetical protein